MYILGMILVFVGGFTLSAVGFGFKTWQYWAVSIPLIIGAVLMEANQ